VYIPDRETPEKNYTIAEDFAEWLTKTTRLTIHGGFENASISDTNRNVGNERTWSLVRRMVANFKALEQVEISSGGWGLYFPPIFEWLVCHQLKALRIHGISEWRHGPVELQPEVRMFPLPVFGSYITHIK
jgi:hypothetical protein